MLTNKSIESTIGLIWNLTWCWNCTFAQVLATGLSGLYSSLPTKLEVPTEEWHCLHREDWLQMPSLVQFLNSLEFCNAVIQVKNICQGCTSRVLPHEKCIHTWHLAVTLCMTAPLTDVWFNIECSQVAHPDIRDQLVGYIYNGFLVPVLAPALHKVGALLRSPLHLYVNPHMDKYTVYSRRELKY